MKISILKDSSLIRESMLNALRESFVNDTILTYYSRDYSALLQEETQSDLVIIDLNSQVEILSIIDYFKDRKMKIIVWTSSLNDTSLLELFKLDLNGYFFNGMEKEELASAITTIRNGGKYIHTELANLLLEDYVQVHTKESIRPVALFTEREWEVLELLTEGRKNEQICRILCVTQKTVKNHVSSILRKLDVPDRTNAVLTALRNNWFYV
ncbi:response regulator transcription factor [Terrihalobacillus insolitus]|uniref:response regulator transcription factor n=1 Tax=Terrihalobacillus insolitus TaxID=2950438 RepID=UPI002341B14F|nr:response regulator transcription factor [Terrihalobacillus insolitus]MDC3414976.1 response regulator transcription factor [Terrihalobacillus insolitus]